MNTPEAPAAPDPAKTAAAQSQSNRETAVTQYGLNATNQVTPNGSLTYKQIGTWADGTPRFEATTSLSDQQQQLYDKGNITQNNLADIGTSQSAKIGQMLNTPFDANAASKATADNLTSLATARLDPQFAKESAALETSLINKGVRPGSEAWNNAQTQFSQQKNDAYNQLYLNGQGQAYSQALSTRNQPINEITALLSGSQVSQPNFTNTPQPGVAPTDVIGAVGQSLAQQNVGYNAQVQNQQLVNNGLFKLGNTALGGWMMSDIETKENIEVVGERADGLHVIDFDYKPEFGGGKGNRGFMAQEVAEVYPDAVARVPAFGNKMAVNYAAVPGGLMALGRSA